MFSPNMALMLMLETPMDGRLFMQPRPRTAPTSSQRYSRPAQTLTQSIPLEKHRYNAHLEKARLRLLKHSGLPEPNHRPKLPLQGRRRNPSSPIQIKFFDES